MRMPGSTPRLAARLIRSATSAESGRFLLEIDLVEEGVTWFSAAGAPALRLRIDVK